MTKRRPFGFFSAEGAVAVLCAAVLMLAFCSPGPAHAAQLRIVATSTDLLSTRPVGEFAYVTDTGTLYIRQASGWTVYTAPAAGLADGAVSTAKLAAEAVTDAKVATTAAIARSKVATGTAGHVVVNDGSTGALSSVAPGTSGNVLRSTGTGWASSALVRYAGTVDSSGTLGAGSVGIASVNKTGAGVYNVETSAAMPASGLASMVTLMDLTGTESKGIVHIHPVDTTHILVKTYDDAGVATDISFSLVVLNLS